MCGRIPSLCSFPATLSLHHDPFLPPTPSHSHFLPPTLPSPSSSLQPSLSPFPFAHQNGCGKGREEGTEGGAKTNIGSDIRYASASPCTLGMPTPRSRAARACARARAHRRGRRRASDARHPQALDGQPTSASPAGPGHHVGVLLTAALGRGPERGLPPGTEAIAVGWRCTRPGHPRGPHQVVACRSLLGRTRLGWAGPSDAGLGHRIVDTKQFK